MVNLFLNILTIDSIAFWNSIPKHKYPIYIYIYIYVYIYYNFIYIYIYYFTPSTPTAIVWLSPHLILRMIGNPLILVGFLILVS
jgi:hypothetical protein